MNNMIAIRAFRCALLLVWLIGQPVHAADADMEYRVLSVGSVESCHALNAAVTNAKEQDDWGRLYGFSLYTMGYLSAVNRLASDTYDIAGRKNVKTLMVWLQRYCREHPQESFADALYQLVAELYPARISSDSR